VKLPPCVDIKNVYAAAIGADSTGHGGHGPPLSLMAGHGGTSEQNIEQEIAKYFLS